VLDDIRSSAERYSLRQPFESARIVRGQLGHDAVASGAATLVVEHHLARGFWVPAAHPTPPLTSETSA
jgi:hypothetical protein